MARRSASLTALTLVFVLLAPSLAGACVFPVRRLGPMDVTQQEIRRPVRRTVDRGAWGIAPGIRAARLTLSQIIVTRGHDVYFGAAYARQRAISIDAAGPDDHGWMFSPDTDPATPPCAIVGHQDWLPPRVRVLQTATQVRITGTVEHTPGDRTGCVLTSALGQSLCPNLTRTTILLKQSIGNRELSFEGF